MTAPAPSSIQIQRYDWRKAACWALYDFANTGYSMIVLALVFPRFYRPFFAAGLPESEKTFWFGVTISVASIIVAILAPFLGSIGEITGTRKRLLLRLAVISMIACASLALVEQGLWWLASLIHIVGLVCFYSANLFFDSMLELVSTRRSRNLVSGIGYASGYFAGFLLILFIAWFTADPPPLGIGDQTLATRLLFVVTAVWWGFFSLPLAIGIREKPKPERPALKAMLERAAVGVKHTFFEIIRIRPVRYFLLAYLFYIDGLNTITITASNLAEAMGFEFAQTIRAFLIVQIAAVPFSILFGFLANRFGAKTLLLIAMVIYLGTTLYGAFIDTEPAVVFGFAISEMYVLALLIGCVIGGVQSLSRSFFANLIPPDKNTAFFGFYSMIGKSAAILGPALLALCAWLFNDPDNPVFSTRVGFGAIGLLFIVGGFFLAKVDPREAPGMQPDAEPNPPPTALAQDDATAQPEP
ncbi:MAG: MFS transporter [Opitutales bacterium]